MEPTILTTLNVTRVSFGGGSVQTTVNANLPLDTPCEKLATFIRPLIDPNITPEKYRITAGSRLAPSVTTGASTYTGDLKINVNEPLAQYYKDYRRHHGRASGAKSLSDSSIDDEAFNTKKKSIVRGESSTITVGPARFKFNRTLRVPDNANRYALPPGLGTFPVAKVQDFRHSLPPKSRSAAGINAITGGKRDEKPPNGLQDYVVGGKQPWLDGIVTEPGVVQQFVAMKLGYRYTVEEQLSDTMMGGIQIDVFPSIVGFATFYHGSSQRKLELALDKSPEQQARRTDRHDQHSSSEGGSSSSLSKPSPGRLRFLNLRRMREPSVTPEPHLALAPKLDSGTKFKWILRTKWRWYLLYFPSAMPTPMWGARGGVPR
ncbi:hypothetical protein B0H14DRAFT_2584529 [Mycena olivaceomarginata]|nr:hypothetical protein B0H14DRAFT_2584529 [Mycena olivaceomarginata]